MNVAYTIHPNAARTAQTEPSTTHENSATISVPEFETFAREYEGRLRNVARRLLRSEEDAEDALQDALLAAFASRRSFRGTSTVYTWLYRIVVNTCLMKIRARPPACMFSLDIPHPTASGTGRRFNDLLGTVDEHVDVLEREETRATIRACIDQLPDGYRTIICLRDIERCSTAHTAKLLELSRVAVKTRLHRARQTLRLLLEPLLHV